MEKAEPVDFHKELKDYSEGKEDVKPEEVLKYLGRNVRLLDKEDVPALDKLQKRILAEAPEKGKELKHYQVLASSPGEVEAEPYWIEQLRGVLEAKGSIEQWFTQNKKSITLSEEWIQEASELLTKYAAQAPDVYAYLLSISDPQEIKSLTDRISSGPNGPSQLELASFKLVSLPISDEKRKIALVTEFANKARSSGAADMLIDHFNITDRSVLAEISEILFVRFPGPEQYSRLQFVFQSPEERFSFARRVIENHPEVVVNHIEGFDIESEKDRITLAKIGAKTLPRFTPFPIGAFDITDQAELEAVAWICARRGLPFGVLDSGITKQSVVVELVKQYARIEGLEIAKSFSGDRIEKESDRAAIFKLCVLQNPEACAYHANFNLSDHKATLEIVKLGLLSGARPYRWQWREIRSWELLRRRAYVLPEEENSLSLLTILSEPPLPSAMPSNRSRPGLQLALATAGVPLQGDREQVLRDYIQKSFKGIDFSATLEVIRSNPDLVLKVGKALIMLRPFLTDDQVRWVEEQGFLKAFAEFRRPALLDQLIVRLALIAPNDEARSVLEAVQPKKLEEKQSWRLLANIAYADLQSQGISKKAIDQHRTRLREGTGSVFNDPRNVEAIVDSLVKLCRELLLEPAKKEEVLRRVLDESDNSKKFVLNSRVASSLLLFNELEKLTVSKTPLVKSLEAAFRERVGVGAVENFATKYEETFRASRKPMAITIYAAKMASLPNPVAAQALNRFVTHVLNGTFKEFRYGIDGVKQLFADKPKDLEVWQEALSAPVAELVGRKVKEEEPIKMVDWLKLKAQTDKHLPMEKLSNFQAFLEGKSGVLTKITEERTELIRAIRAKEKKKDSTLLGRLSTETDLIKLAEAKEPKEQLRLLRALRNKKTLAHSEFLNDIQEMIGGLSQVVGPARPLSIYDTDEWDDLLLCGYEVLGSCQRLDGNPRLNRGLLGYLLHGWNRVLKLAEGPNEPFKGRCLIRLMWDGRKRVLLRERFYPATLTAEQKTALNAMAKRKADRLGVSLVSMDGKGEPYRKTLRVDPGVAPYEYWDSAGGLRGLGSVEVSGARLLA